VQEPGASIDTDVNLFALASSYPDAAAAIRLPSSATGNTPPTLVSTHRSTCLAGSIGTWANRV
jgi:hypothetical protein